MQCKRLNKAKKMIYNYKLLINKAKLQFIATKQGRHFL